MTNTPGANVWQVEELLVQRRASCLVLEAPEDGDSKQQVGDGKASSAHKLLHGSQLNVPSQAIATDAAPCMQQSVMFWLLRPCGAARNTYVKCRHDTHPRCVLSSALVSHIDQVFCLHGPAGPA